jgi:TPP-dependent indolepyruvate ferredoxin oxidoreductase alpha subunit
MDNQNNQFNGQFNQEQFHQFHQQQQAQGQQAQQPLLSPDAQAAVKRVMKANGLSERDALNFIILTYACLYRKGG